MTTRIQAGMDILTADNEKVGEVARLVVDPQTHEISHIVVEQGFIFKESRVLPLTWIDDTTSKAVQLRDDVDDLDTLPPFEEKEFVTELPEHEEEEDVQVLPLYWYPSHGATGWGPTGGLSLAITSPYMIQTQQNIPEGTVALEEGMQVLDKFEEHIGDVASLFIDEDGERVTHILISKGFLLTEEKRIPAHWITRVLSDSIHLAVSRALIESLPEHETSA